MAKTRFLQIRLSPEDRKKVESAASAEFLDVSTWARRVLLQAVAELDKKKRVAKD